MKTIKLTELEALIKSPSEHFKHKYYPPEKKPIFNMLIRNRVVKALIKSKEGNVTSIPELISLVEQDFKDRPPKNKTDNQIIKAKNTCLDIINRSHPHFFKKTEEITIPRFQTIKLNLVNVDITFKTMYQIIEKQESSTAKLVEFITSSEKPKNLILIKDTIRSKFYNSCLKNLFPEYNPIYSPIYLYHNQSHIITYNASESYLNAKFLYDLTNYYLAVDEYASVIQEIRDNELFLKDLEDSVLFKNLLAFLNKHWQSKIA